MKRWWLVVGALVLYLVFLLVKLPAQFAFHFLPAPKDLHVGGVSGTVWQGQIQVVHWQGKIIREVNWDLNIPALFTGALEADIIAGQDMKSDIALTGTLGSGFAGWYAEDIEFSMPASLAAEFAPMPVQVDLQGRIDGQINAASQGEPWCETLDGTVTWRNPAVMAAALGNPLKLDETRAQLRCNKGEVVAQIEDDKQVMGLELTVTLGKSQYLLSGTINPGPEFPNGYKQGLMFVATPLSNNSYQLELDGEF